MKIKLQVYSLITKRYSFSRLPKCGQVIITILQNRKMSVLSVCEMRERLGGREGASNPFLGHFRSHKIHLHNFYSC